MATITPFGKKKERPFTSGSLPMPDGTRRTYKEFGRNPVTRYRLIIMRWQADIAQMKLEMFLADCCA